MAPRKLKDAENTDKIEFKIPADLKRKAQELAAVAGDGDVSSWLRGLIKRELRAAGMLDEGAAKRKGNSR